MARVAPELKFSVEEVIVRCVAVPATIVNVVVSEVRPLADAVSVTEPAVTPVTVLEAVPEEAVAEPVPLTEPEPVVCEKLTEVELSVETRLLFSSRISAVIARVPPELKLAVELVIVMW